MEDNKNITSTSTSVSCNGLEATFDHPTIYLEIDPIKKSIDCPYCGKKFVLDITN